MIVAEQQKTSKNTGIKYLKFYIFHSLIYILDGSGIAAEMAVQGLQGGFTLQQDKLNNFFAGKKLINNKYYGGKYELKQTDSRNG